MCGIAGSYSLSLSREDLNHRVTTMLEKLAHRGPDSSGLWANKEGNLCLGHRRLAIQDLTPAGHQPMISKSGRYTISYNGEVYNFQDLAVELRELGVQFRGHSDTEVILEAVELWGLEKTLSRVSGMYAFALYDAIEQTLWLARDRMGEKPLYIYGQDGNIFFASELKALLNGVNERLDLSWDDIDSFFCYGYFTPTATPFRSIRKLPPATFLRLKLSELALGASHNTAHIISSAITYWSEGESENVELSDSDATDLLEEMLTGSVGRQMIADVDIGVFLSGGVDSSVIAALVRKVRGEKFKSFTVAFEHGAYNEAGYAREVANHLGGAHTEIPLHIDECLKLIKILPDILDEPFADASFLPSYLVSREARKYVTVCLSGDGGDELFCGYNRYLQGAKYWRRMEKLPWVIRSAVSAFLRTVPVDAYDSLYQVIFRILQWMPFFKSNIKAEKDIGTKVHKLARILVAKSGREVYAMLLGFWHSSPLWGYRRLGSAYIDEFDGVSFEVESFEKDAMKLDRSFYLPCDNLFKTDRSAMASSLEVRLPLLDHGVVDYAASLKLRHKIRKGKGKWLLRQVLYRHVPADLIDRPKMGFSVPLADWLRHELKDWAEGLLRDQGRLRCFGLDSSIVQKSWVEHLSGKADNANAIWAILVYILWYEKNKSYIAAA